MQAILFDLGDTLINFRDTSSKGLFESAARNTYAYLKERGEKLPEFQAFFDLHYHWVARSYLWSRISGREFNALDITAAAAKKLGIKTTHQELLELAWMWYVPAMEQGAVDSGVREMLAEIRAAGVKMCIVSNTFVPGHCLDRHLELEGLLEFFPTRIYSCEVRYRKPHRRIFEIALNRIQAKPERSIFVGDLHSADIIGARKLGMKTVWKPVAGRNKNPKRHKADVVIQRITDLPAVLPGLGFRVAERDFSPAVAV